MGEMFHNFMLEEHLQAYMGVDFGQFKFDPLELKGLTSLLYTSVEREEILNWHNGSECRWRKVD